MKRFFFTLCIAFGFVALPLSAKMIAFTVSLNENEAISKHKQEGAKTQIIPCNDSVYQKVIRAKYRDQKTTYLSTDAIAVGDTVVSKQVIVCKDKEALYGLATWFNQQKEYKQINEKKCQTEINGISVVIYFEPVDKYGEGIIIEKERFK